MIKEKDLAPGKVITSVDRRWSTEGEVITVTAWMVLGFERHVKRRHSRSSARRDGWHVLLLRWGDAGTVLNSIVITPYEMKDWKRFI